MNVFYVDDDADDQALFVEAIEDIQSRLSVRLTLHRAENGLDFFNLIEKTNLIPDITFLDINMPKKDGFHCLLEIRSSVLLKGHPVIMLSTSSSRDMISKSLSLGADKYIIKPSDFGILKSEVEKCIKEFYQPK